MESQLKDRILANRFIDRLRTELVVDEKSYEELCAALRALAEDWRGQTRIDKELMQNLYVLAPITRNVGRAFMPDRPDLANAIDEKATELDALVMDCLQVNEA